MSSRNAHRYTTASSCRCSEKAGSPSSSFRGFSPSLCKIYQEGECQFRKFIKKENLKVNPEIRMTQAESEMESAFMPGSAFLFNVILQLEKFDSDEDSEEQSDSSE